MSSLECLFLNSHELLPPASSLAFSFLDCRYLGISASPLALHSMQPLHYSVGIPAPTLASTLALHEALYRMENGPMSQVAIFEENADRWAVNRLQRENEKFQSNISQLTQDLANVRRKKASLAKSLLGRIDARCAERDFALSRARDMERLSREQCAIVDRLQQQIAHAPRATECCVCTNAPPSVLYLPCKHLAVCSACDDVLERQGSSCPICRGAIHQRHPGVILP